MTTSKKIKVKRQQKQTIYSRCLRKSFSYFCGNHACQKTVQHFIRRRRIYDPVSFYLFFYITAYWKCFTSYNIKSTVLFPHVDWVFNPSRAPVTYQVGQYVAERPIMHCLNARSTSSSVYIYRSSNTIDTMYNHG